MYKDVLTDEIYETHDDVIDSIYEQDLDDYIIDVLQEYNILELFSRLDNNFQMDLYDEAIAKYYTQNIIKVDEEE